MDIEITNIVVVVKVNKDLLIPLQNQNKEQIGKIILNAFKVPEEKELMKYLFTKYTGTSELFWYQLETRLDDVVTSDMFITSVQFRSSDSIVIVFKKYK